MRKSTQLIGLILLFAFSINAQSDLVFSEYLGLNSSGRHHFAAATSFPEDAVSEDYGPRGPHAQFHGGIDCNSKKNDRDGDIYNLLHSLEPGTGIIRQDDGAVQNNFSKHITVEGHHNVRYIHILGDGGISVGSSMDWGGVEIKHIDPNPNMPLASEWAIIFKQNGNYTAIGPVAGTVTFTDEQGMMRTISVSNTVSQGDPIAALGNSKGFVGAGHLHIELLENSNLSNTPADDAGTGNPLAIMNYNRPIYDIKTLKKNDTDQGVELVYPGTNKMTLQARVGLAAYSNGVKRYNEILNVEIIDFQLKSDLIPDWIQMEGKERNRIILGGILPIGPVPTQLHNYGYYGTWGSNDGGYTEAYWSNPYDDWYINQYYTRMHKDYNLTFGGQLFTDIPKKAKYNDGDYNLRCRVFDIHLDDHYSPDVPFTLDNFMPFIDNFSIETASSEVAFEYTRTQDENGSTLDNGMLQNTSEILNGTASTSTMTVKVKLSEPMDFIDLQYQLDGEESWSAWVGMSPTNDPLTWQIPIENYPDTCVLYKFRGKDKSGNDLINVYGLTENNSLEKSILIPTRSGTSSWNNSPSMVGEDYFYSCTVCEPKIPNLKRKVTSIRSTSDCDTINFSERIEVTCDGTYYLYIDSLDADKYEVGWKDENGIYIAENPKIVDSIGTYCYIVESRSECCSHEGCMTVTRESNFDITYSNHSDPRFKYVQIKAISEHIAYPIMVYLTDESGSVKCPGRISNIGGTASCTLMIGKEYCIMMMDSDMCQSEYCFTVEGQSCPDELSINLVNLENTCGDMLGSIGIDVGYNECPEFSIAWTGGSTSNTIDNLPKGKYCVVVTSNDCPDCVSARCYKVQEDEAACQDSTDTCDSLTINASTYDICSKSLYRKEGSKVFKGNYSGRGLIQLNLSGCADYSVRWQDGVAGTKRYIYTEGTYTATITNNCCNTVQTRSWTIQKSSDPAVACQRVVKEDGVLFEELIDHLKFLYKGNSGGFEPSSSATHIPIDSSIHLTQVHASADSMSYEVRTSTDLVGFLGLKLRNLEVPTFDPILIKGRSPNNTNKTYTCSVFPNPFSNNLNIQIITKEDDSEITCEVFDQIGRRYYINRFQLHQGENTMHLDKLGTLPSGLLFVKLSDSNGYLNVIKTVKY